MGRKKIKESEKNKRINISMDKSVYNYLKDRKIRVSTYINQMLKVAIGSASTNDISATNYTSKQVLGKDEVTSSNLVWSCLALLTFSSKLLVSSF
jgi:hypothetical protein